MLAGGNFYPYSCKPEDVWMALEKDRENLFFYRRAGARQLSGLLCPRGSAKKAS
ncbi:cryptic 6-phospho-beta-glucosidase [Enterobacter cloacae subsp. cloacae GS1]|nr:cryptic 6-phospho-beta-glucosidase [Enterobacter cloacae subsp. cloacae GS1]